MFNLNLIANVQSGFSTFTKIWVTTKQIVEFIEKHWVAIGNPNLNFNKSHISVVLSNNVGVMVERSKAYRAWTLLTPHWFPTFDKKGCKRRSVSTDNGTEETEESSSQKKRQKRQRTLPTTTKTTVAEVSTITTRETTNKEGTDMNLF
jgi:hypothetical protein